MILSEEDFSLKLDNLCAFVSDAVPSMCDARRIKFYAVCISQALDAGDVLFWRCHLLVFRGDDFDIVEGYFRPM